MELSITQQRFRLTLVNICFVQLSINEYRKRKQLSSDNEKTSPTKAEPSSNNVTTAISTSADSTSEPNEGALVSPISKKSPADDKVTGKWKQKKTFAIEFELYKNCFCFSI